MNVVLDAAIDVLGHNRRPLLDLLAECGAVNLEWYIQRKIIGVNALQCSDNERVLKYAYNFCLRAAEVTFLREGSALGAKTPDLKVEMEPYLFYVEVKKFRGPGSGTGDPVSKIVYAATEKRIQLPPLAFGFVAIDNFDLDTEWDYASGPMHGHIVDALCELRRLAAENPGGWEEPSGVVISANTAVGEAARRMEFPHFVWVNQRSNPPVTPGLVQCLSSALPNVKIIDTDADCPDLAPSSDTPGS